MTLFRKTQQVAGLPQLDVHTLSEDWALARGLEETWQMLAQSLGKSPSNWLDTDGVRMYGAVVALSTWFDLVDTIREDDEISIETRIVSIRKPHALAVTEFKVGQKAKAETRLLTSFIKRQRSGSNKKFAKVRDMWQVDDFEDQLIDDLLAQHNAAKSESVVAQSFWDYEVNRIQDFNTADFLYFKNFVRIAKSAEWRQNRGAPTRLNTTRRAFFFGNVEDGEIMRAGIFRNADSVVTELQDTAGQRLFLSLASAPFIEIATR
jgi:probable biosynthetic protein (TIGR04098 family)